MPDNTAQPNGIDEPLRLRAAVLSAFTPGLPVNHLDLLAGRSQQITKILEAVISPGQHATIYGERGVGKSSLANLVYDMVFASGQQNYIPVRINCSVSMTFSDIWLEIFRQLEEMTEAKDLILSFPEHNPSGEDIRNILRKVARPSIIVIDEYDRVDESVATNMADTIKTLSDRGVPTTLVIVGVADSVEQLIREHSSIDRALIQIPMPRMLRGELIELIQKGMARLPEITMEDGLDQRIVDLSKGLPHFTHLLAKHSLLTTIDAGRRRVTRSDYEKALKIATEEKSQSLGNAYRRATHSAMESTFEEVLLACALSTDEHGLFGAKDVRVPLTKILKKPVKIEAYIRHLDKFSQEERGPVLKKEGKKRRFQYSFVEPMMQPYVLMKGLADGKINEEHLNVLSDAPTSPSLFSRQ